MDPKLGIVVYHNEDNEYYLEKRRVVKTKDGGFRLGAGAPLKRTTLKKMLNALVKRNLIEYEFKNVIPKEVLHLKNYNNGFKLIWILPACQRPLHFVKALNIPDGMACLPNLIFKYDNGRISVAATKTKNITADTILYKAPFHNLGRKGDLCKGSGKYSTTSKYYDDIMDSVMDGFFSSRFSHHNDKDVAKVNINIMWKEYIESQHPYFNNDNLKPMGISFEDFI